MPHGDTSVTIQQAIIKQDTTHLALIATQRHKRSYTTSYQISAQNTTQGFIYNKLYILIPKDGDNQTWLYINTGFQCSKYHTRTQAYIYQQDIYIDLIQMDGDDPTWLYISTQGFSALNTTQGHKRSYTTSYQISALITTQGHKPSYQQAIFINPKGWGRSNLVIYQHRVSVL